MYCDSDWRTAFFPVGDEGLVFAVGLSHGMQFIGQVCFEYRSTSCCHDEPAARPCTICVVILAYTSTECRDVEPAAHQCPIGLVIAP